MLERKTCPGFAESVIGEGLSDTTKMIINFLVAFGIGQRGKTFTRTDAINALGLGRTAWEERVFSHGFRHLRSAGIFTFCRATRKWRCWAALEGGSVTIPSKQKSRELLEKLPAIRDAVEQTYEMARIEFALGRELTVAERERFDDFEEIGDDVDGVLHSRIKERLRAEGVLQ